MFARPVLAAALWLTAAGVKADPAVEVFQGPLITSSRVKGLAGAYVAVAEGQDGQLYNAASLAHRTRWLGRGWDWDFVLDWDAPSEDTQRRRDFDNDGLRDGRPGSGAGAAQLGLSFQWRRFGVGAVIRGSALTAGRGPNQQLEIVPLDVALGVAYAFWREQLIVGVDYVAEGGEVELHTGGETPITLYKAEYGLQSARPGILWRPRGQRFRVGLQVDLPSTVRPTVTKNDVQVLSPKMAFPAVLRLGTSLWLGDNAGLYNQGSLRALWEERREAGEPDPPAPLVEHAPGGSPVLLSAEVDLTFPTRDSVSVSDYIANGTLDGARRVGRNLTASVHAGAEWEAIRTWLVIRGGSYLEPSRYRRYSRIHGTFGLDLRVPIYITDLRAGVAGDVASRYQNVGFTLGLWHERGPWVAGQAAEPTTR
jgi:hypothetical protein